MGCITILVGALAPRLALFAGWSNDQPYWDAVFGSQLWLVAGFLFLPWTTLIYGLVAPNGLTLLNIVFLVLGFVADLTTWGIGGLAGRKEYSAYRGT
jgi:hypothetical protein